MTTRHLITRGHVSLRSASSAQRARHRRGRSSGATAPTASKTRADVTALASEQLGGRQAGSDGAKLAADYLVAELTKMGAKPLPGQKDFRLPFSFTAGVKDGGTTLRLSRRHRAAPEPGRRARFEVAHACRRCRSRTTPKSAARSCSPATASSCPSRRTSATTATPTLDVKDKVVVVLPLLPGRRGPEDPRRSWRATPTSATRRMQARQRGAKALLVVTGPRSPNAGETIPMSFDTALAGSGIVAASISGRRRDARSSPACTDKTLDDDRRSRSTRRNPHAAGFALPT